MCKGWVWQLVVQFIVVALIGLHVKSRFVIIIQKNRKSWELVSRSTMARRSLIEVLERGASSIIAELARLHPDTLGIRSDLKLH